MFSSETVYGEIDLQWGRQSVIQKSCSVWTARLVIISLDM